MGARIRRHPVAATLVATVAILALVGGSAWATLSASAARGGVVDCEQKPNHPRCQTPTPTPTPTASPTLTPTPTPTEPPAAAPKVIGMSAPDNLWSTRLAEVGACGVEARRIYATLNSSGDARMTVVQQAVADSMMPVISYKVPSIATAGTGGYNTWAANAAARLDALGVPVVVTVWHEPNGDMTGPDFVAMHEHLDPVFQRGQVKVGPIFNGFPLDTAAGRADLTTYTTPALFDLWDYFGIDTYNAASDDRVPLMEQFVADQGHPDVPLLIGEYNATSAADLTAAGDAFLASPTMWAFLLWNSGDGTGGAQATPVSGDRLTAFQATKADARALHEPVC